MCWVLGSHKDEGQTTKSIKPEANFILEKEKKISMGHQKLTSYCCDRSQRWASMGCFHGLPFLEQETSIRHEQKNFYNLKVKLGYKLWGFFCLFV